MSSEIITQFMTPKTSGIFSIVMSFFLCGTTSLPIKLGIKAGLLNSYMLQFICLLVMTSIGNVHLYSAKDIFRVPQFSSMLTSISLNAHQSRRLGTIPICCGIWCYQRLRIRNHAITISFVDSWDCLERTTFLLRLAIQF